MSSCFLKVQNLRKSYGGLVHVLDGMNFQMEPKERIVVIGPSGSGKSTLLRCIMGLEKIDDGRIEFEGARYIEAQANRRKDNLVDTAVRAKIGMVFQHYTLFPHLTVLGNLVLSPIRARGESRASATERAMQLLKRLGLDNRANAYPGMLSGGQKQRVAIAAAIAAGPKLLIADEATSALDTIVQAEIVTLIRQLVAEDGMTLLFISHDIALAAELAERIAVFRHGQLVELGVTAQIVDAPTQAYTRTLLDAHIGLDAASLLNRAGLHA